MEYTETFAPSPGRDRGWLGGQDLLSILYLELSFDQGIGLIMSVILCLILKCFFLECESIKMNKWL